MSSTKRWLGALSALAMLSLSSVAWSQTEGLRGEYYVIDPLGRSQPSRAQLFGCKLPEFTRIDPNINFDWGGGAPNDAPQIGDPPRDFPVDGYAVRWTGTMIVDEANAGERIISGSSDDGIRIWIKDAAEGPITATDAPLVNAWADQGPADRGNVPFTFVAGREYHILVEFYENGGGSVARVNWRFPDETVYEPIPSTVFTPAPATTPQPDNVAPSAPGPVTVTNVQATQATLNFTAPGNDGATGAAGCYEIRYSNSPLTAETFSRGIEPNYGLLVPAEAGTPQTFTLSGLLPLETYYVGVRARDIWGNVGPLSNIATFSTTAVPTPTGTDGQPGAVAYLYSPTPRNPLDRLTAFFIPTLFRGSDVVTTINQNDAYAASRGLPTDGYAIRYSFTLTFPEAGTWWLNGRPDDGMRIWFSDSPIDPNAITPETAVVNTWANQGPSDHVSDPIDVAANTPYYVYVEYYESGGGALAEIRIGQSDLPAEQTVLTAGSAEYQMRTHYLPVSNFPSPGRLRGQVVNTDGSPVTNAVVTVTTNGVTNNYRVNSFGVFSTLLNAGSYTYTVSGATPTGVTGTGSGTAEVNAGQIANAGNITITPITLPANSLPTPVDKVVFREPGFFQGGWISQNATEDTSEQGVFLADRIADYFQAQGFTVVDAAGLQAFMESHVASGTPSVVVMANDLFPETVVNVELNNEGNLALQTTGHLLRSYLENGGRVVTLADIPLYDIGLSDGSLLNVQNNGSINVLGFNAAGGAWDTQDQPRITPAGEALGLTSSWIRSLRPANPGAVDVTLANSNGGSAGYLKLYPNGANTGAFIRVLDYNPDMTGSPITDANLADVERLAEFGGALNFVTPVTGCKGDANGDGAVNVADAVAILQHAVNIGTPLSGQNLINAQVTAGDTEVNVADAVAVLQAIVGVAPGSELIPNLNCP